MQGSLNTGLVGVISACEEGRGASYERGAV
jgi:hypothetical protein